MTDNKNRTTAEIRHLLTKYGGNMAAAGSVAFQFSKKGYIAVEKSAAKEDVLMELALEAGAEDFKTEDADVFEILTDPASFEAVKAAVEEKGIRDPDGRDPDGPAEHDRRRRTRRPRS